MPASAQTKVNIGISGWTGFAPLTLAKEAGIFAKNGLDVTIKKIPQASRHLAIASGDIQCAATTVETWMVWNANGVATTQLFQLDKSYGADGLVGARQCEFDQGTQGQDGGGLGARHLALFPAGLVPEEERPVAQGRDDREYGAGTGGAGLHRRQQRCRRDLRAVSLGGARRARQAGKIIATTLDYPMVMDTFGCTPKFIAENEAAVKALTKSYFEALDMIKTDEKKAYEIMGADVKQTGETIRQFGEISALAGSGSQQEVLHRRACRRFRRKPPTCCLKSA